MRHTVTHYSFHNEMFWGFVLFSFYFLFSFQGGYKGRGQIWRDYGDMSGTGVHNVEFTKESTTTKEGQKHSI